MIEYTDNELLLQFRDEQTRNFAFNQLVRKYQERLYYHVRKIVIDHDDAHDVIQNVFIKVWKHLDNFKEESGLYTWLYRIATNEALTFLRKKKKNIFVRMDDVMHEMSDSLSHDPLFSGDGIQRKLQEAILKLPEQQRIVFNMKYFEEMKYEEISEILGISVGGLKASFHHAVKKIEKFIKGD